MTCGGNCETKKEKTMKKCMIYLFISAFATGLVYAEEEASVAQEKFTQERRPSRMEDARLRIKEHRQKLKMKNRAFQSLVKSIQDEVDEVKKSELIEQLRAKLTKGSDKMKAGLQKQLERAEEHVERIKKRLMDAENKPEEKIEERIQKLLSGEMPARDLGWPESGFPDFEIPPSSNRKKFGKGDLR